MVNLNVERALNVLRYLPRVCLDNVRPSPNSNYVRKKIRRGQHAIKWPQKGAKQRLHYERLGHEGGQTPFCIRIPQEPYYKDHHLKRQYPPYSLKTLQLAIDLGRMNPDEPVDLASICNSKTYRINPLDRHFGVQLTADGADIFRAKVNIEVQYAPEAVIAAVERNGGTISLAYYDIESVIALCNPLAFFQLGLPIPRRLLPPEDAIRLYTDAKFRGYLADPEEIARERFLLAQKYGYELPNIAEDPKRDMLLTRKDPRQVFLGLEPGWVVNLKNRTILKPENEKLVEYYKS